MLFDLRTVLSRIALEYPLAKKQPLKNHPLRKFIEKDVKDYLNKIIKSEFPNLHTRSSAQQGRWNIAPWIIFTNNEISTSARRGFYVNYSFSSNFKSLVLHIGQGYEELKMQYGKDWKLIRDIRSQIIMDKLENIKKSHMDNPSLLKNFKKEKNDHVGSFFGKIYSTRNLPINKKLLTDLNEMLSLYEKLIFLGGIKEKNIDLNEHTKITGIEHKKLISHKRLEYEYVQRNSTLINKLKNESDLNCEACRFNFNKFYKKNPDYIEAHHLKPVSKMKINEVRKLTKKDIALLCANCHRMIHQYGCPNLKEFKKQIKLN